MASVEKKIYSIEIEGVQKFEQQLDRVGQSFNEAEKGAVDLRKELKETLKALRDPNLDQGSKKFKELTERAGQLKDEIGDVNARVKALASDTKQLDGFIDIASGITAGFGLAQGTLALFGAENKKLEETLLKVQSSIAILNSLQAIQNLLQKESAANLLITNALEKSSFVQRVAGNAQLLIENGLKSTNVVVTTAASVAQRALNAAMSANPILLLVSALGGLIAIYEIFINTEEEATEKTDADTKAKKENEKATRSLTSAEKDYVNELRNKIKRQDEASALAQNTEEINAEIALERAKQGESEIAILEATIALEKEKLDGLERLKTQADQVADTFKNTTDAYETANAAAKALLEVERQRTVIKELEKKLAEQTNVVREAEVQRIKALGLETNILYETEKKRLKEVKLEGDSVQKAVDDEIAKLLKRKQEIIQVLQAVQQFSQIISQTVLQATQIQTENQIKLFQKQIETLNEESNKLNENLASINQRTNEIEEALSNARGRRRERLINDLKAQQKAEEDIAKRQKKVEQEKAEVQKKINQERLKQQKLEIQLQAAQITVSSALAVAQSAVQAAGNPAAGLTFGLSVATTVATVAAAIGVAIAKTRQLNQELNAGFADGGYTSKRGNVDRTGHRVAGVVHSNEYVVPQRVLANPKGQRMVAQLDKMRKGFADGGFTTPNFQSLQEATTPNIDTRPIYVAVTDINLANERLNKIKSATVI